MMHRALLCLALTACAAVPETHRYTLVAATIAPVIEEGADLPTLTVEELEVDPPYDDPRIAYRPSAYRFESYHYHRWSAPPSLLVSEYFRDAFSRSGHFARVTRAIVPQTNALLRGRLTAFEEVDVKKNRWVGRVALELSLEDPTTGKILWSRSFDESEPLVDQSPDGLARALSTALQRIARATLPSATKIATSQASKAAEDSNESYSRW
ncbi:MAG TPA: ABC-type transport auxiliary lipoprotein family protein [Polyangiaceae bacterium]|nr:ABC-type transport auxiliary lipoprotein family protein [Polyangiaceae bacterium]